MIATIGYNNEWANQLTNAMSTAFGNVKFSLSEFGYDRLCDDLKCIVIEQLPVYIRGSNLPHWVQFIIWMARRVQKWVEKVQNFSNFKPYIDQWDYG